MKITNSYHIVWANKMRNSGIRVIDKSPKSWVIEQYFDTMAEASQYIENSKKGFPGTSTEYKITIEKETTK